MLTIHPSTRFKRSFKRIPPNIKEDFAKKIDLFKKNPFHRALCTHKLRGSLADYYAFCLRDGFRVLFDFIETDTILLINVGSHNDYQKWSRE